LLSFVTMAPSNKFLTSNAYIDQNNINKRIF
jgi:hypothetical protein